MAAKNNRVAIFLLEWDFQVHTEHLVESLVEQGFVVDLFLHATGNPGIHTPERISHLPNVRVLNSCNVQSDHLTARYSDAFFSSLVGRALNRLYPFYDRLQFAMGARGPSGFARSAREFPIPTIRAADYAFAIGVEDAGFVWASSSLNGKCPVFLYSLELFIDRHPMYAGWRFKALRKRLIYWLNRASGLLIQDDFRAAALLEAAGLGAKSLPVYRLPVSVRRRQSTGTTSLRQRLGLSDSEVIVVYFGNLTPIRHCVETCEQATFFPNGWTLVLHGRWMGSPEYKQRLNQFRGNPRIRFSESMVEDTQVQDLIRGCDVGLALYANVNQNYYHTGYASEKLATYFSQGVPVVTYDYPTNLDVFSRWKCGVPIANICELTAAVHEIMNRRAEYSAAALAAFDDCYNFDTAKKVISALAKDALR